MVWCGSFKNYSVLAYCTARMQYDDDRLLPVRLSVCAAVRCA